MGIAHRLASIGRQIAICDAKRSYRTRGAALIAAYSHTKPPRLRPYQCPICAQWHLTKKGV